MNFWKKIKYVPRRMHTLLANLKALSARPMNQICENGSYETFLRIEQLVNDKMFFYQDDRLKVLSDEETWTKILEKPKSFVRIGDGELGIIGGQSQAFQNCDERLAQYLKEILQSTRDDIYVGIDYSYFHGFDNVTETIKKHNYLCGSFFKNALLTYCGKEPEYISSSFNQLYVDYVEYDWDKYIHNIKQLFQDKDITVICGEGILSKLTYNVFDCAKSVEYLYGPARNAFEHFNELFQKAMAISKNRVVCVILGPTAKPLVWELNKAGYTAWDLGHMAKDYDACIKRVPKDEDFVKEFFAPD